MRKVDDFCTLRGHSECGNAQIDLTGFDGRNNAVKGHVADLKCDTQRICDLLCKPDIAAGELSLVIEIFIGRIGCFCADNDLSGSLDAFQGGFSLCGAQTDHHHCHQQCKQSGHMFHDGTSSNQSLFSLYTVHSTACVKLYTAKIQRQDKAEFPFNNK